MWIQNILLRTTGESISHNHQSIFKKVKQFFAVSSNEIQSVHYLHSCDCNWSLAWGTKSQNSEFLHFVQIFKHCNLVMQPPVRSWKGRACLHSAASCCLPGPCPSKCPFWLKHVPGPGWTSAKLINLPLMWHGRGGTTCQAAAHLQTPRDSSQSVLTVVECVCVGPTLAAVLSVVQTVAQIGELKDAHWSQFGVFKLFWTCIWYHLDLELRIQKCF